MFYGLIMWAIAFYAFRKGGWEEKLATVSVMIGSYASALVAGPHGGFRHLELSMAIVDLCLLLSLQLIALRSTKFWPLWLTAVQGVTVLGHLSPLLPDAQPATSHNAVSLWSYPALLIIAIGIRNHREQTSLRLARPAEVRL